LGVLENDIPILRDKRRVCWEPRIMEMTDIAFSLLFGIGALTVGKWFAIGILAFRKRIKKLSTKHDALHAKAEVSE